MDLPRIGGAPVARLSAPPVGSDGPRFLSCDIAPGRGMMILQARAAVPGLGEIDVLHAPRLEEAARQLSGDFAGSASYAFGGAILAPYANRIRGRLDPATRTIETEILGKTVRLPANHGGKAPGAELYAMHGLILDAAATDLRREEDETFQGLNGRIGPSAFMGRWPGALAMQIGWAVTRHAVTLHLQVKNEGDEPSPVGVGWHPYFALPSGRRAQATLSIPGRSRALVNDYDEVLPTGAVEPVEGTPYQFWPARPLGDLYLDDCFCDLVKSPFGETIVEIADPAASFGLRVVSPSPAVTAVQTYAPPDKAFVVVEPQFNLADPFGQEWRGRDTGMVVLPPGRAVEYEARIELFVPRWNHG